MLFRFRNNPLYDFNTVAGGAAAGPAAATGEIDGGGDDSGTPLAVPTHQWTITWKFGFSLFLSNINICCTPASNRKSW